MVISPYYQSMLSPWLSVHTISPWLSVHAISPYPVHGYQCMLPVQYLSICSQFAWLALPARLVSPTSPLGY